MLCFPRNGLSSCDSSYMSHKEFCVISCRSSHFFSQIRSMCASGFRGLVGLLTLSGCVCRFMSPYTSASPSVILALIQPIQIHCTASLSFTKNPPHHCSCISALCRIHKTFSLIASGTTVLLCSPLAVSSLSHSPTSTLKRNFLACIGRIKACAGRTVRAV